MDIPPRGTFRNTVYPRKAASAVIRSASAALVLIASLVLSGCQSGYNYDFAAGSTEHMLEQVDRVVAALNERDEPALKGLFTTAAQREYSGELDSGIDYLMTSLPEGSISWTYNGVSPSAQYRYIEPGRDAVMLHKMQTIDSGGNEYWLYIADFYFNGIDTDNVGIYAIALVKKSKSTYSRAEERMYRWTSGFDVEPSAPPGVYVPG